FERNRSLANLAKGIAAQEVNYRMKPELRSRGQAGLTIKRGLNGAHGQLLSCVLSLAFPKGES
ncbi:MAG: hypothetical protein ABIH17_11470, partial [Pseudomonadota bacterium]